MGQVAKAVIGGGGVAKGIVPVPLYRSGSTQLKEIETVIVPDMHTRKKMMSEEVTTSQFD
jgi:predicted Rossmann-fold nucleotide-binding protein